MRSFACSITALLVACATAQPPERIAPNEPDPSPPLPDAFDLPPPTEDTAVGQSAEDKAKSEKKKPWPGTFIVESSPKGVAPRVVFMAPAEADKTVVAYVVHAEKKRGSTYTYVTPTELESTTNRIKVKRTRPSVFNIVERTSDNCRLVYLSTPVKSKDNDLAIHMTVGGVEGDVYTTGTGLEEIHHVKKTKRGGCKQTKAERRQHK